MKIFKNTEQERSSINKVWILSSIFVLIFLLSFSGTFKGMMLYLSPNLNYSMALQTKNEKESKSWFPAVSASNLEGQKFNLPGDFSASYNVVVLAYTREHQSDINTWLPLLKQTETANPEVRYYELPTLPNWNAAARAQLDRWMIEGIPNKSTRERTITLYLDVEAFNDALNIDNRDEMQILLVTKEGKILWQEKGSFSTAKGEALLDVLGELMEKSLNSKSK